MKNEMYDNSLFKFVTVVFIPSAILLYIYFNVSSYYHMVVILFMINIILAASLNITNGFTGIFSMGQAGFMGIGAYIGSLLTMSTELKISRIPDIPLWIANIQLPFFLAMPVAGAITMIVALIIGFPVLRAKGHYLAVMTLGMIIIIKAVLDNNTNLTNGAKGLSGMTEYSTLPVVFVVMILSLYILHRITVSAYGRNMIALRDDEDAAASLGINATKYRMISFVVSAFFGAVGGCLWAHLERSIAPSLFYFDQSFSIVEMSVLGGMASLSGAIPGAAVLTFLPQILANYENGFNIFGIDVPALNGLSNIVMSILFILVILFKRNGITGNSDYIVNTMFNKNTYLGLFKKETYIDFWNILSGKFRNINLKKYNKTSRRQQNEKEII